jgi:predicted dehydrogenase
VRRGDEEGDGVSPEKKVALALVGCGGISGSHVKGYRDLWERGCRAFEVTACCDAVPEKALARAREIAGFQGREPAVFASVAELVKSGAAAAADVCVPHCFHHTAAVELLSGGLHVLLEKPLGITVAASRAIIAAAAKAGRVLSTAENIRRGLSARACRWALSEKKLIGDVRHVDVQMLYCGQLDFTNPIFKWRGLRLLTGGGMIMDSGAHFTDMLIHLFGEPETVWAEVRTLEPATVKGAPVLGDAAVDVEDEWLAVISFRSGTRVVWSYCRVQPGSDFRSGRYYGTEGTMECLGNKFHAFQDGGQITLRGGAVRSKEWIEAEYQKSLSAEDRQRLFPWGATDGMSVEVGEFVRAVGEGGPVELDGLAGLRAKALSMACYESNALGRAVKFADVLAGRLNAYQRPIDEYWKLSGAGLLAGVR